MAATRIDSTSSAKDGRVAYKGRRGPFGFRPDEMEDALKGILASGGVLREWRL